VVQIHPENTAICWCYIYFSIYPENGGGCTTVHSLTTVTKPLMYHAVGNGTTLCSVPYLQSCCTGLYSLPSRPPPSLTNFFFFNLVEEQWVDANLMSEAERFYHFFLDLVKNERLAHELDKKKLYWNVIFTLWKNDT